MRAAAAARWDAPACARSFSVPLRCSTSRSTGEIDMRPRVRPDMIPANITRTVEIPR